MADLTEKQIVWLRRLAERGTWPDRPFINDRENSIPLMQMGLVELVKPGGRMPHLPYAMITPAGRLALDQAEEEKR